MIFLKKYIHHHVLHISFLFLINLFHKSIFLFYINRRESVVGSLTAFSLLEDPDIPDLPEAPDPLNERSSGEEEEDDDDGDDGGDSDDVFLID